MNKPIKICMYAMLILTSLSNSSSALPNAKSMAIMSSAKAQINHQRGSIRTGRKIEYLGSDCKLNIAPVDGLIEKRKPGKRTNVNLIVEDVVPICEAAK